MPRSTWLPTLPAYESFHTAFGYEPCRRNSCSTARNSGSVGDRGFVGGKRLSPEPQKTTWPTRSFSVAATSRRLFALSSRSTTRADSRSHTRRHAGPSPGATASANPHGKQYAKSKPTRTRSPAAARSTKISRTRSVADARVGGFSTVGGSFRPRKAIEIDAVPRPLDFAALQSTATYASNNRI